MTQCTPRLRKHLYRRWIGYDDGDKLPIIARWMQRQLQNAIQGIKSSLAIGDRSSEGSQEGTTRSNSEQTDTLRQIGYTIGVLRREAFIVVIVAGN